MVSNAEFYFDNIVYSGNCKQGNLFEFKFRGQEHGLMLNEEKSQ